MMVFSTGTPSSRVRMVVALQKYYKGLKEDISDLHLGIRISYPVSLFYLNNGRTQTRWSCLTAYLVLRTISEPGTGYVYLGNPIIIYILRNTRQKAMS